MEPARILVRAANWIGDAVMSLPALHAIRARFPQAYIAVLARPWVADLYARESSIDRLITEDAKWSAFRKLRAERFDCAVLFPNSFQSALIARLAGIRRIIGYRRDARGWLLSDAIPWPRAGELPAHERFRYLELLRRVGWVDESSFEASICLSGVEQATASGRAECRRLGITLPAIGVSPGAAFGSAKRWIAERFAEAAARLAEEHSASVILFGSDAEFPLCHEVESHITRISRQVRVYNQSGRIPLRTFVDMAAACDLFLTNDSGAMHIASALGIPSITVFGPTDPDATGPTGAQARIVREPVSCSPCLLRECPIDHRCMTGVAAERVVLVGRELLSIG